MQASDKMISSVKGSVVVPHGTNRPPTCDAGWILPAKHSGQEATFGIGRLTFEWIINGETMKLKSGKDNLVLPVVWGHMVENIVCCLPIERAES